jgi:hypothetical protein
MLNAARGINSILGKKRKSLYILHRGDNADALLFPIFAFTVNVTISPRFDVSARQQECAMGGLGKTINCSAWFEIDMTLKGERDESLAGNSVLFKCSDIEIQKHTIK